MFYGLLRLIESIEYIQIEAYLVILTIPTQYDDIRVELGLSIRCNL